MLTPSQYDQLADSLAEIYAQLEESILQDMVRRMVRMGFVSDSTEWQARMLQESGMLYDDILAEIAQRTGSTQEQLRTVFQNAGVQAIRNDNYYYQQANVYTHRSMSDSALQVLNAGYIKCSGNLKNLTLTTANTSQQAFIQACNLAYMQVSSGMMDYNTAIRKAVQNAAKDGSTVLYPSGHRDKLDVAVRRAVLTGVGQTVRKVSFQNAKDLDCDLMELTAHAGARPSHAEWQGQIVSLSGRKGYLTTQEIGYGSVDGFGGVNCRHDWHPYFEGLPRTYSPERLKELNTPNIQIGDKLYTDYEVSQMQRALERKIREKKRQVLAAKTHRSNALDEAAEILADEEFRKKSVQLKQAEQKLKDFLKQTGFLNDSARLWVNGFGRSEAQKAVWANRKYQQKKTANGETKSNMNYMSNSFRPDYSKTGKTFHYGTTSILTKKVENSQFQLFADDENRRNKAVRIVEKTLRNIQKQLPENFEMPPVAVVDFDTYSLNLDSEGNRHNVIGGYVPEAGTMYFNSQYDTKEKILTFVNKNPEYFANKTEYAPFLHELGHKYYEDSVKTLAISEKIEYNKAKSIIDHRIFDYIRENGLEKDIKSNLSIYAQDGYDKSNYTELIAESFSVKDSNELAKNLIILIGRNLHDEALH